MFYASSAEYNPILKIKEEHISLAICADIGHPIHAENASNNKATLYLPSIFFSEKGIAIGHQNLATYAKTYQLNILMSNYSGNTWQIKSGGKSAFWNNKGNKLAELNANDEGLLMIEKDNNQHWKATILQ